MDDLDKKLLPIRNYLDQPDMLLIYYQFKCIMENTPGNKRPANLIAQYTEDFEAFKKFIKEEVYPNVRNRSIKRRCTMLIKSLNNPEKTPNQTPNQSDTES